MGEELAELGEKILDWTQPGDEGVFYAKILTCRCGQKIKVLPSVVAVRCVECAMKEAEADQLMLVAGAVWRVLNAKEPEPEPDPGYIRIHNGRRRFGDLNGTR